MDDFPLRIDLFLTCIEYANAATGLLSNSMLLFAISKFSGTHLGAYKYLLKIFTIYDLFFVVFRLFSRPCEVLVGNTQGIVTDTPLDDRTFTALYAALQSVPFNLLVIHFLYRYWAVCRPHLTSLFRNTIFVLFLVTETVGEVGIWYVLCQYGASGQEDSVGRRAVVDEYERMYGKRIEHAWLVFDHWRDNQFDATLIATIVVMNIVAFTLISITASLACLAYYHIHAMTKISPNAVYLPKKLLIALCVQAAVPSVLVYIPYLLSMNIPLLGVSMTFIHNISAPVTAFFPTWDAVVMILLLPDYRRGLAGMVRRKRKITLPSGAFVSPGRSHP